MKGNYLSQLLLSPSTFLKTNIVEQMDKGGFKSIARFELFIWDLEIFLQIQRIIGDGLILKGGAATQFYIPPQSQRTSIDIDMICLESPEHVHSALRQIEERFSGDDNFFHFLLHSPKKPKLEMNQLETYYLKVPSICDPEELYAMNGKQEVKVEFQFSHEAFPINKKHHPSLFAVETDCVFNLLPLECLFADKLTTFGTKTIGIPEDRADEHFKQVYDVISLFISNSKYILDNIDTIKDYYEKCAILECKIHHIDYDKKVLYEDLKDFIQRLKQIDYDSSILRKANDFQSLYLRHDCFRNKSEWVIVGCQLELLVDSIFTNGNQIKNFYEICDLIEKVNFPMIQGPERGGILEEVRSILKTNFSSISSLPQDFYKRKLDRVIWELCCFIQFDEIKDCLIKFI